MKPIGLGVAGLLAVSDVLAGIIRFQALDVVALSIDVVVAAVWLVVIKASWVRGAGQTYAERVFEMLESDGLTTTDA